MRKLGHLRALDGLRGLAVLVVVARHAFPTALPGGGQGVELFFVLSGFLITTLLLDERDATGSISLRSFYQRRCWRLLPALGAFLTTFLAVEVIRGDARAGLRATAAAGFYTANITHSWFAGVIGQLPVGPLWSLSQEEQFYLVWPLLLVLLSRRRLSDHTVTWIVGALLAAPITEALVLSQFENSENQRIYTGPDTHAGGLLAGTLLALIIRSPAGAAALSKRTWLSWYGCITGVILALGIWAPFAYQSPFAYAAAWCLVATAVCQPTSELARTLRSRPLVWFGRISYSLYLWHVFFLWLLDWHNRGLALLAAGATAYASTRWLEEPLRRRGRTAARERVRSAPAPAVA